LESKQEKAPRYHHEVQSKGHLLLSLGRITVREAYISGCLGGTVDAWYDWYRSFLSDDSSEPNTLAMRHQRRIDLLWN
jgi:hypothetical protein